MECRMGTSGSGLGGERSGAGGGGFVVAPTISARSRVQVDRGASAFWGDAFRPFYLGGVIFGAGAVPLWLGVWYYQYLSPTLPGMFWHMHEMVFGFAVAIIIGFLFTAGRNWTGLPLPAGMPLAILFGLWIGARVGMFVAYGLVTAVVDVSLLVIVAGVLAFKFIRARSWSNMPLVLVLSALASVNMVFHGAVQGLVEVSPVVVAESGLMLVVLVEMIVGGRVVPAFTASAVPGVRHFRSLWLQRGSFGLAAAVFGGDALGMPAMVLTPLAIVAAGVVGVQAAGWNPWAVRGRPMLWVLHAGYWFIPVGLLLLGLSAAQVVSRSAAVHALAVGSTGGLIMGMITRTALGHSGRPVRAGRLEVAVYVLVLLSAVLRVGASLIPVVYLPGVFAAGIAWTGSLVVYLVGYIPVLTGSRVRREAAPVRAA